MNEEETVGFVKSRDEALIHFVRTGKMDQVEAHCEKYGVKLPKDERIRKAALYKAVQRCTDIPDEIKSLAAMECMKLGFSPFMHV